MKIQKTNKYIWHDLELRKMFLCEISWAPSKRCSINVIFGLIYFTFLNFKALFHKLAFELADMLLYLVLLDWFKSGITINSYIN